MDEQAVGEHRNLRRILNRRRYGNRPLLRIARHRDWISRQLERRIYRERYAVVSRMVDRFLHLEMQLRSAHRFRHRKAEFAPVGIRAAAWTGLLRVSAVVLDDPRGGFDELEVGEGGGRRGHR